MVTLQVTPDVVREAGKVYDVPTKEARELIDARAAVAIKDDPARRVKTNE